MFNTLYTLLALFLVFTESMHVCNLILVHMYFMHSDSPLNPGVTIELRLPRPVQRPVGELHRRSPCPPSSDVLWSASCSMWNSWAMRSLKMRTASMRRCHRPMIRSPPRSAPSRWARPPPRLPRLAPPRRWLSWPVRLCQSPPPSLSSRRSTPPRRPRLPPPRCLKWRPTHHPLEIYRQGLHPPPPPRRWPLGRLRPRPSSPPPTTHHRLHLSPRMPLLSSLAAIPAVGGRPSAGVTTPHPSSTAPRPTATSYCGH
jgi:hypothetical protein